MRFLLLILVIAFCTASPAGARRSLMDDAFSRPSEYTRNRMRVHKARTDWKVQRYNAKIERSRIRTNELRRRDYLKNQAHNQKVLESQRTRQYKHR